MLRPNSKWSRASGHSAAALYIAFDLGSQVFDIDACHSRVDDQGKISRLVTTGVAFARVSRTGDVSCTYRQRSSS